MYEYSYLLGEGLGLGALVLLRGIPTGLLNLGCWILLSYSLYRMAVRRGIRKPWLAWLPVGREWIIGSLSDQYRYVVRGERRAKRWSLTVLQLLRLALGAALCAMAVALAGNLLTALAYGRSWQNLLPALMGPGMSLLGLAVPMLALWIAGKVIWFLALYDIYTSAEPGNRNLYLILSIPFSFLQSVFLFLCREKDEGMPPRRDPGN